MLADSQEIIMDLLTIENGELRLNSNLDEYTFGKTGHDAILSQEGALFDGKNFRQWTFEEVKSYDAEKNGSKERLVFYCVKNPLSDKAKTLSSFYEEGGDACFAAVKAVCAALCEAAKNNNSIPSVGPGGILVDGDKVLFAPQALFDYAANTLSAEDKLNLHSGFLNETISGLPAICFERASLVYRLLSGQLPFTASDSIARNADIFDHKFLPLEYCVNGIDSDLAAAVNKALCLNSTAVTVPGKKQKGKSSDELKPEADFPLEKLEEAYKLSLTSSGNEEFEEKVAAYLKSQNSKISTKRKLKKNATTIAVLAFIAFVFVVVSVNSVKNRQEDYTSIGLTSTETIRAFMGAVNDKDTTILTDFGKGRSTNDFSDMVSRMYVMHKQRLAYANDNGYAAPAGWIMFITNEKNYARSGIYGLTNLTIDGKAESLALELKKRKEKPAPLEKEGSVSLYDGLTSVHKVEYYMIYTEGEEEDFVVEKVSATVTLTFTKNRWIITDFISDSTNLNVSSKAFKQDYFAAVIENDNDAIKAIDSLRKKYVWLPEKDALQREKERIEYELAHPFGEFGL